MGVLHIAVAGSQIGEVFVVIALELVAQVQPDAAVAFAARQLVAALAAQAPAAEAAQLAVARDVACFGAGVVAVEQRGRLAVKAQAGLGRPAWAEVAAVANFQRVGLQAPGVPVVAPVGLDDAAFKADVIKQADALKAKAEALEAEVMALTLAKFPGALDAAMAKCIEEIGKGMLGEEQA